MSDTFTEYSHEGFGSRIGKSIKGVFFGAILFLGSFVLLAWNEKRAVTEIRSLEEGRSLVRIAAATQVEPSQEGKLIFTSGLATTDEIIRDSLFALTDSALKLRRTVEMYQWDEDKDTEKTSSGDKKTTYTYKREWSTKLISSSDFRHESGHENPASMPFHSDEVTAKNAHVGVRELSPGLLSRINSFAPVIPTADTIKSAPTVGSKQVKLEGERIYYGADSNSPAIGDVRVRFDSVKPVNVSLIAQQTGMSFSPYQTKAGNAIELLEEGLHDSNYVFEAALKRNAIFTWILRGVGWFVMFLGIAMFLGPLATLTEVIPILGSVVGLGIGLAAFVLASILSTVTVALSWFAVRPLAGGIALVLAAVALWGAKKRGDKKIENTGTLGRGATPPPPPPTQNA